MPLTETQRIEIENVLKNSLRYKFQNYKPEPASMPFHTRLLGKDRLALYSFIHSLSTNFGTSIFEPVAKVLAKSVFKNVDTHVNLGSSISESTQNTIQEIMNNLSTGSVNPNKPLEIESIRKVCNKGKLNKIKITQVDIYLEDNTGALYLFDLKTAKPNAGGFKEFKRTLLEWVGVALVNNPDKIVNTYIAIPYNPYEPEKYQRWTMRGMLDIDKELMVGNEFWNFIGGGDVYNDLLGCFERVGIELRPEIDNYFARFTK